MSIEVGQKITGKVTGITHFGAFISLPDNKTGLVHISEVSDGYVKEISSVLTVGQEVAVKVLSIADDGKISLSIRQASDRPAEAPARPKRERQEGAAPHINVPHASRVVKMRVGIALTSTMREIITAVSWMILTN